MYVAFRIYFLLSAIWLLVYGLNDLDPNLTHVVYSRNGLPWYCNRLDKEENTRLQQACGTFLMLPPRRVAFGKPVSPNRHPWSVVFVKDGNTFCSGTLISDRHVLTAAHCFFKFGKKDTTLPCKEARFVENYYLEATILYGGVCTPAATSCKHTRMRKTKINRVIVPYAFSDSGCSKSDYAIVELVLPLELSATVWPICLSRVRDSELLDEEDDKQKTKKSNGTKSTTRSRRAQFGTVTHLGWGWTEFGRSALLHYFNPKILDVRESTIITTVGEFGKTCAGDSGGTLEIEDIDQSRFILLGITSMGMSCPDTGKQQGYTFSFFVPDILDVICHYTGVCPHDKSYLT